MDRSAVKAKTLNKLSSVLGGLWRAGFVLLVIIWLGWLVINSDFPTGVDDLLADYRSWLFVLGWAMFPIGLGLLWRLQLRVTSDLSVSLPETAKIQALAWAGRYLPGKAGLWIAKIALVRRGDVSSVMLASTVLVEQLLFVFAGIVVALFCMAFLMGASPDWPLYNFAMLQENHLPVLLLVALLVMLLVAAFYYSKRYGQTHLEKVRTHLPPRSSWPGLILGHIALHVLVGISLFPLLAALLPDVAVQLGLVGVVGALALANVSGILALFAPAGLGVRELVLAFVLAVGGDYESALVVAVFLRLLTLLADVIFSLVAGIAGALLDRSAKTINAEQ